MRISDWGSDVCSSDLAEPGAPAAAEEEPMELSQVAASYDDTAGELVLDAPEAPASDYRSAPAAEAPAESPARSAGGGTLFERMSRLSRGASTPDAADGGTDDGVDVPRFLGRQNHPKRGSRQTRQAAR